MLRRGSRVSVRSLLKPLNLVILSGTLLILFLFLRKKIILSKQTEIHDAIVSSGISETLAKFMTAQSAFETAGFVSPLTVLNNNYFGMKYAGQSLALGERSGFAYYESMSKSVADYCVWWIKVRNHLLSLPLYVDSLEKFVTFLNNNDYFEDNYDNYLAGVKRWYNQLYPNA
jgi:hypothetical protein